jgi:hypothetical protein
MNKIVCCAVLLAAVGFAADLPVTEVILYKNGIGYFVRSGELKPGESAALRFKAEEMNDVLKSLTIFEDGGGKVSGLHYDSSEPIETKLARFPFKFGDRQPLSTLLDQLRGARVEMKAGTELVAGLLVGARETTGYSKDMQRQEATLLVDSGELRTIDLTGVTALHFTDAAIQGQLKQYLGEVAAGRSKEKRSVYIDSTGTKQRRLTASYVIPTPVWKSSYRLVFTDAAEPTLEGWAIVDNTSGEDWSNVRLALVSGRPVSFVSKLYEPRYVGRRSMDVLDQEAAAPEIHQGGIVGGYGGGAVAAAPAPLLRTEDAQTGEVLNNNFITNLPQVNRDPSQLLKIAGNIQGSPHRSAFANAAEAAELGELFEYSFATPVTVRAGESAMLPFLQQKIGARKLLIYTGTDSQNPRNAVELTNTTGKTLDGGPVTVFDGNAYAGEALVEPVKQGDKRLISYAVDLGTRITTALDSSSELVREVHMRRGILTVRSAVEVTTTYTIRNVDRKPKTLVIEHAIRPEYKLIKTKPSETTSSAYRFEVKLAASATDKLAVAEERVYDLTVALASATPDVLFTYVHNKDLGEAARKQLEGIARQKNLIAANDADLRHSDEQINELVRDQERLRENIRTLNNVTGQQEQVQKYARQLASQEGLLASLRDRQSDERRKKAALESDLGKLIETTEF